MNTFIKTLTFLCLTGLIGIIVTVFIGTGYGYFQLVHKSPVEVHRVQLAMPDTYFPTDLRIGLENQTTDTLRKVQFIADYKSPNTGQIYWTRLVECETDRLAPGDRWQGKCFFKGTPPEKRNRPNAAVFLEMASINPTNQ